MNRSEKNRRYHQRGLEATACRERAERLAAMTQEHRALHERGFPCSECMGKAAGQAMNDFARQISAFTGRK